VTREFAIVIAVVGFTCGIAAAFLQFGIPAGLTATGAALVITAMVVHDAAVTRERTNRER